MDAAEPVVHKEEAAAEQAGCESMSGEEEDVTWEELRNGILALTPTSSLVPAIQHHQKQGPLTQPAHPSDFNVQVHDVQEASYLTAHNSSLSGGILATNISTCNCACVLKA